MENKVSTSQVSISPSKEKGKIHVKWTITTLHKEAQNNGSISCFIPSLNIYFHVKNHDDIIQRSKDLSKIFFDHYLIDTKKNRLKGLVMELYKLGFKADTLMHMKDLMNNKRIKASLNALDRDIAYSGYKATVQEVDLEVSI